jgi:hypothetical protein
MTNTRTLLLAGMLSAVTALTGCTTTAGGDPTPATARTATAHRPWTLR